MTLWVKRKAAYLWSRLRSADIYDWGFSLLFLSLGALVVTLLYTTVLDDGEPFTPLSFENPARVIDENGLQPSVEGYAGPAVYVSDGEVPVRVTRIFDCAVSECPDDGMTVSADVVWERLDSEGVTVETFTSIEDFETVYVAGDDYEPGKLTSFSFNPPPIEMPPEVADLASKQSSSAWRIDGIITVDDRQTAIWNTEVFQLVSSSAPIAAESAGQ